MKTINEYFDELKEKTGSDYATAKALGIGKSSLSMIRTRGQMADDTAVKVAQLLEIDESEVLITAAMARSEGAVKTAWGNVAKKAGIAASVLLLAGLASLTEGRKIDGIQSLENAVNIHYAKSSVWTIRRAEL